MNKATNSQNGKNAVDVSKLFNGKEYKNYSELAKEMGWRLYKSGSNGQNLQFKRLSEVCRWGRDVSA